MCVFSVISREFHTLTMAGYFKYSREQSHCADDYLMQLDAAGHALVKQVLTNHPVCPRKVLSFAVKYYFFYTRQQKKMTNHLQLVQQSHQQNHTIQSQPKAVSMKKLHQRKRPTSWILM